MEGVERMNMAMVNPQQRAGFPQRNPYAIDVDRRENRNYYVCRGFGHLARNCRNEGMEMNRRMEVDNNNNLKEEQDLIVFNYIPVTIGLQCSQEQQITYLAATLTIETC